MQLKNVTLEMSLKPFREVSGPCIERVCREVFRQWAALLRDAEQVSVLLWTADGSEILTYQGKMEAAIEWGRYVGSANPHEPVPGDPEGKCLHSRAYLYTEKPAVITYGVLARIVATLRRVGRELTGLPVRVGATFDPGCEFAVSPFKYQKHREICMADTGGPQSFACCYATLNADGESYRGFPDGIPQGTPLGTFLGRQSQHFLADLGFDYLWFSNGFGFGLETWMARGPMFDGRRFDASRAGELREKILGFWRSFRAECPGFAIETRGTNLSTGIDLASDAVPWREIYGGGFRMTPPPNSPWAAINGDFGIELAGWMSHIAELPPDTGYPFRFYTHDPWWHNSPWLDRYMREPHDIYLPLAVSRIDGRGRVEAPNSILFLTIDDSLGRMPEQVPNEVIPHVQECRRQAPDQPGPLVWIYPWDEYHEMTFGATPRTEEAFFGDWFVRSAIRNGLPLNTVVSSRGFLATARERQLYRESVLVTRVPDAGTEMERALLRHVREGGRTLLYGPMRGAGWEMLGILNLRVDEAIAGELAVEFGDVVDELSEEPHPKRVMHREVMSAGGCEEVVAAEAGAGTRVLAWVSEGPRRRVAAVARRRAEWNGGAVAWVRGTCAGAYVGGDLISGAGHLPKEDDPNQVFHGDLLMRWALAEVGPRIAFRKRHAGQRNPMLCIARHANAFLFSGYGPDLTVEMGLRFPQGAPVFVGWDAELVDGEARYRMPRAWRRECRVFVEQQRGVVSCVERCVENLELVRRLRVVGLEDAVVRFYPPPPPPPEAGERKVTMVNNGAYPYFEGPFAEYERCEDEMGKYLRVGPVSGELLVSW